jgi:hypothetical protein
MAIVKGHGYELNIEIGKIYPPMAQKMLDNQIHNRKLKNQLIYRLIQDLKAGKWPLTGEAIIENDKGQVINGQHRLTAIVKSGIPMVTLIIRGIKEDAEAAIDTGRQRTPGDVFQLRGVNFSSFISRTSKLMVMFDTKLDEIIEAQRITRDIGTISNPVIYQYYLDHKNEIETACFHFKKNHPSIIKTGRSVMSFVLAYLKRIDEAKAYEFIESYETGTLKNKNWRPLMEIRDDFMTRDRKKVKLNELHKISTLFGLWNVIYHGDSLETVKENVLNLPREIEIKKGIYKP